MPFAGQSDRTATFLPLARQVGSGKVAELFEWMKEHIAKIICCPGCHGELALSPGLLSCKACAARYQIQGEVPVFTGEQAPFAPSGHQSNSIGPDYEAVLRVGKELILHIGAGATSHKHPNCVELEHKIFQNTDVVGDAHALPFRDNLFDRVFAFNVFEHLRDPYRAAAEVWRVLKPNGSVAIHTAFLQPLHEAPAHYFNATEFGVRSWFSEFQIDKCHVSGNFGPGMMLGFLMSVLAHSMEDAGVSASQQRLVLESRLGDWARFWRNRPAGAPHGFEVLQNLPQVQQKSMAAGFELLARKPVKSG